MAANSYLDFVLAAFGIQDTLYQQPSVRESDHRSNIALSHHDHRLGTQRNLCGATALDR
jgi:hypothetical protein